MINILTRGSAGVWMSPNELGEGEVVPEGPLTAPTSRAFIGALHRPAPPFELGLSLLAM